MEPSVDDVTAFVLDRLGPTDTWPTTPRGYPDSLALCLIDAIWSMGVRYGGVENIVTRYRAYRTGEGGVAESDDAGALLSVYAAIGGVEAFAETVGNHQRTSTRAGVLKAQAVLDAANLLVGLNTTSTSLLREASDLREVEAGWRALPGQRSGISWHYLLMLVGTQDIKADRMIRRFLFPLLGSLPAPSDASRILASAAPSLGCDLRTLDHAMWSYQRSRARSTSD